MLTLSPPPFCSSRSLALLLFFFPFFLPFALKVKQYFCASFPGSSLHFVLFLLTQ